MPAPSLPAPLPPTIRRDAGDQGPGQGRLTAQPGGGHGADTPDAKPGLARGGAGVCTGLFRRGANSIELSSARTCPPPARSSPCPPPPPRAARRAARVRAGAPGCAPGAPAPRAPRGEGARPR